MIEKTDIDPIKKLSEPEEIDVDKAPFKIAVKEDKRIYPKMLFDNCISKIDLISITIFPQKFDILSIALSLYIFSMALNFTMNSLLFSDDVVSQNYHSEGRMSFLTTTLLSILSNVISIIISFIFVHLSQYTIYFEAIDEETLNDESYCKICSKILKYMKMKLIFYFLLSLIFILAFWYYVTLFCIIYHNNQVNWIIDCVTGIGMSLLYTLGIATLISTINLPL